MVQAIRATVVEESRARISLRELERAIAAADPAAILVSPRLLRRVIKQHARLPGFGFHVPHRKSYLIARAALLSIVDMAELDLPADAELAETAILLARPSAERLEANSAADNLTICWRLLFHARVHQALQHQSQLGRLDAAAIQLRIEQLGQAEFAEIQQVLSQENFLLPPASDLATYVEFAAVFLELRYFAPGFLQSYFPALLDLDAVYDLLAADVDAEQLFQATRPPGAPEQPERRDIPSEEISKVVVEPAPVQRKVSLRAFGRLLDRAARVGIRGNLVRAAILRISAAERGTPELSRTARSEARADMDRLAERLQAALGFPDEECEEWGRVLALLSMLAAPRLLDDRSAIAVRPAESLRRSRTRRVHAGCVPLDSLGLSPALETAAPRPAQRALFETPAQCGAAIAGRPLVKSDSRSTVGPAAIGGGACRGLLAHPLPASDRRGARPSESAAGESPRAQLPATSWSRNCWTGSSNAAT